MVCDPDRNRRAVNIWSARIIPVVLVGVVGYATYVLVALLCVNYLIVKHHNKRAAIPILVVYFTLFLLMAASFLRVLHVTTFDPPYVPLGSAAVQRQSSHRRKSRVEKPGISTGEYAGGTSWDTSREAMKLNNDPDAPGLELFYTKDVFVSDSDGKPKYCSECSNWKPDRAHHSSDAGRCIYKMDHFCPWVGGPIGENNFKFFLIFNGYAALYCINVLVVMAIYIHKQLTTEDEELNRQFAGVLGLASFFGWFTAAMTGTSINLAVRNLTQVENLRSKTKTYTMAIIQPPAKVPFGTGRNESERWYPEITYPLSSSRPAYQPHTGNTVHADNNNGIVQQPEAIASLQMPLSLAESSLGPVTTRTEMLPEEILSATKTPSARDLTATRTFAILRMNVGDNPWDLGSALQNWKTLMGTNVIDWFLPIKRSPCCDHEDSRSQYLVGPSVAILRESLLRSVPPMGTNYPGSDSPTPT